MSLIDKTYLCYINIELLENWIKENFSLISTFANEKQKWKKETAFWSNFFVDTELLLINEDVLILKICDQNHANFLAKTYQLEYQVICQKIFQEKKNIILVTEEQWKEINQSSLQRLENEKLIVLFKDEEGVKKSLNNWAKININSTLLS